MMHGQKVVKVFCHEEEQSKSDFDAINNSLFKASEKANKYANILMPTPSNIGHALYVVVAIVGGILVLAGARNLTLTGLAVGGIEMGAIVAFLNMSRQFTFNISQVSTQLNAVVMAATAGADRIFSCFDQNFQSWTEALRYSCQCQRRRR